MKLKSIKFLCNSVPKQKHFYANKLGLKLVNDGESTFAVQAGTTSLEFENRKDYEKKGYYHFAFNIVPSLLQESVIHFLGARNIPVVKNGPDTFVDFPDWNAKSVYFYDAEENILEFIARFNLDEPTHAATFTQDHIKSISEIGIVVKDTQDFAKVVQENIDLKVWREYGQDFKAIGDEHGLLLDVKEGRPWMPTTDHFKAQLPVEVTIVGSGKNFTYENIYAFNFTNNKL